MDMQKKKQELTLSNWKSRSRIVRLGATNFNVYTQEEVEQLLAEKDMEIEDILVTGINLQNVKEGTKVWNFLNNRMKEFLEKYVK
jgi:hypothetical protein